MENINEPLMTYAQFFYSHNEIDSSVQIIEAYANYHTQWHLQNVKEVVLQNTKTELTSTCIRVDKQSITNAFDNYITNNLK